MNTELVAPSRPGKAVAASRVQSWDALLEAWSENQERLGVITHSDGTAGLLLASLAEGARGPVIEDLPTWGQCTSLIFTRTPDSVTWTVVISGDTQASSVLATARLWNLGADCVSHGVREAELEALVKGMAEKETG